MSPEFTIRFKFEEEIIWKVLIARSKNECCICEYCIHTPLTSPLHENHDKSIHTPLTSPLHENNDKSLHSCDIVSCVHSGLPLRDSDLVVYRGRYCVWTTGGRIWKCFEGLLQKTGASWVNWLTFCDAPINKTGGGGLYPNLEFKSYTCRNPNSSENITRFTFDFAGEALVSELYLAYTW